MFDIDGLVSDSLKLLADRVDKNYRISLVIVGPPGSGKSTIANELCERLNSMFHEYLKEHGGNIEISGVSEPLPVDITEPIREVSRNIVEYMTSNDGILPQSVEDLDFECVKFQDDGRDNGNVNGNVKVIGRGGLPNAIEVSPYHDLSKPKEKCDVNIAQIIPMDGFHLTRKCLDNFKDPVNAHRRRGSPSTFDSNNFLQLCKLLAETSNTKIPLSRFQNSDNDDVDAVWEKLAKTFTSDVQDIYIPGFDHSLKDPTSNQYCINGFTRIMIFEGLYLLYDQENWSKIYQVLSGTDALLIWNIDIDEAVIQDRVAKRHLNSGLVNTFEEGIDKFQVNDLLNARSIRQHTLDVKDVVTIHND
ncbi:hypothetical protein Kpol_467p9 [Vanderwaltozyma polyspora DSM 70294]|uniref:ATP-dependent kinase YFH7 n=1 Tax=Vanderwaltozyma polyspora (strain ATCC 22028 / DSM 70294 / BCRC 21397 / CBS 2163 / NBRC 10782 / NRRL Y-8283 / UCD 57-17) TaxID=436907 RepID=YFH7_VANPO|nr:uncharacterized protein Kpol_467p9 [Vanderwaltozyma polyspora DSM 70294]A7TQF3.1 RecName: Full=ATP-dependent kinase YFH7 [Vanderwaltozyma polyspora DSM 70294]EDO15497.1 hypothetical protein Kpol_467p9 [Vanderwaltozyma polyspora DSM 70294]